MNDLRELLRRERNNRGLTQDQTGVTVNVSASSIGAFETGRMVPMPDTAKALDALFETGTQIQELSARARAEASAPWLRPWTDNEQRATLIRWFEHSLIPGLLQTEAYARAILTVGPHRRDKLDELTAARIERQTAALGPDDPPAPVGIIGEAALRYGDGALMKEQLEHLIDVGDRPNVQIRILPMSAGLHAGLAGAFVVASLPGAGSPRLAYLDDQLRGRTVADAEEIGELDRTWESLSGLALPCGQSRDLILRIIDEHT
ncbi:helix-turn-helix domain-containing protein [Plantactinospora sp. CA-294935]|uniref:helix-turn-helix domain-containing protein n=1 Tax=Plantactinospora sp. CA-294935 TaxID=3240012 RepID=UPI003D8E88BA